MPTSTLDSLNRFIIDDFQQKKAFASFLPGIAGPLGVPLWAFYVNRGQAITSFGVESKDSPILEFQPANRAYQITPYLGFRTFFKVTREGETQHYEPFSAWDRRPNTQQRMVIGMNELELEENSPAHGLKTSVHYATLTGEPFAGLMRRVTIQNIASHPVELEMLDGLPALVPYGVNNALLKEMGRTVEAWMEVFNLPARAPFFRLRATVVDKAEVETFEAGHFALGLDGQELLPVLVDPAVVFGADTAFFQPQGFYRQPLAELLRAAQVTCGRTPCAFFARQFQLAPGAALTINCLYGHISGLEVLQRHIERISQPDYFDRQIQSARALVDDLTGAVATHTSEPLFDAYTRQNMLDNVLRGGWPVLLGEHVYPIYSRKHGDIERDYNAYFITPEPYSQGEGSYRDVNQNRRDTVLLNPRAGDSDIRAFMSLIQTDGYNPRVVRGSTFALSPEQQAEILAGLPEPETLRNLLARPFTPGKLLKHIADAQVHLPGAPENLLIQVMRMAEERIEADFFEGFWIDHWEYNLDLIESYLAVFPDRQAELFFGPASLPFYESPVFVQPRAKKYVLSNGKARQIGSLLEDHEKAALIRSRAQLPNWTRAQYGHGDIYRATLFAKLALTVLLKFTTLDPFGMGIEMEAGRPGWYDALNGLPALFGSGLTETFELQRWLSFLRAVMRDNPNGQVNLPVEVAALLDAVLAQLAAYQQSAGGASDSERDFRYWDAVSTARETYRAQTRLGLDGAERSIALPELDAALAAFQAKVTEGIQRALALNGGFPPTYLSFEIDDYDVLPERDSAGRPLIRPKHFTPAPLPAFLEGPVRAMKVLPDVEAARHLHQQVKHSPLYDRKLKMYKVNASLESQPHDIGRARAFPPGWLENESIWLHMEYKYLLEMLRAGLYSEFFEDMRCTLAPFLDPEQYGRSPLENASFLASSAHPDPTLHGTGFVARLSGSTAEFLSMWTIMMAGKQPFQMRDGQLSLVLQPALPGWLFDETGAVSFRFLGSCTVTYHNPRREDIYGAGAHAERCELSLANGEVVQVAGAVIGSPYAEQVRAGQVQRIEVFYP